MKVFNGSKIPVFLKAWSGSTEKVPQNGETKVVKVTLAIDLDAERAADLQPGDGEVKNVMFKAADDGGLRPFLRAAAFDAAIPKQKLLVRATPDSPVPSICFDHVKFAKTMLVRGNVLFLKATIGPCGPGEYAALGQWHESDRFVDFEEAEPELDLEADGMTDADEKAQTNLHISVGPIPPEPMWDETEEQAAADAAREEAAVEQGHRYPKKDKSKKQQPPAATH